MLLAGRIGFAQTNTGLIAGTVHDTSGGVLPGVTVTVRNLDTGIARLAVTGAAGTYVVTNLAVGRYAVAVELSGFRKAEKSGFDLVSDGRITADFVLDIGTLTEAVLVTAIRTETVNRTSGEIARVIDGDQVRELALSGRNFLELASLIPGAVQLETDQMAITTGLGTGGTVINGVRGNSNNLTVDGGFNLDSGSNASMINNVGLNFIEQVKIQTSNFFKSNTSWNGQRVPPYGDAWKRDTYGFVFPQVFSGGRYDEGIPDVTFSGTGAPADLIGPSRSLLSPTTDITAVNTLTWIAKAHALRAGGLVTRNRKDQNGRLAHTGAVTFNPSGNTNTTGPSFADALLGNFRTYSEGADDPIGFFRFTQSSAFASDNWRIRPNLSLELGVRYELASPIYTQGNNISNFDPALYDASKAVTVNRNGSVVAGSGNPYIGMIRAGADIPNDQQGRVALDSRAASLIPIGAPRGLFDTHQLFMPRFSAAYSLNTSTVLRGGVGLFHDKPEGNVIFSQVNLPPFVPSVSVENGNLGNPLGGRAAAEAVLGTVNAIDPHLKVPRQWNFSVSLQRELAGGHFAEIAYVGNRGRNLLWFPEINAPSFEDLNANMALPTAQRANNNSMRPYKGYSSIRQRRSDAFVDYNALQLYLNKRKGDVRYTFSYTLSKAAGNVSDNGIGGNPEDAFNFEFNYGPTSYDRRHVLISTWTYRIPFLRNRHDLAGTALGGWELSGKTRWQSGQYLTPTGATLIATRRADYTGAEIGLPSNERSADRWFNTVAFVSAPDTRRGNATVGMIEGPHLYTWDVSLRKYFRVQGRTRIGARADMFNAFNRVNYANPATNLSASNYGQISDARPPRQMQLSLQLEF